MTLSIKTVVTNALKGHRKSGETMLNAMVATIAHGYAHNDYSQFNRLFEGYGETPSQISDFKTVQKALIAGKWNKETGRFSPLKTAIPVAIDTLAINGANDCNTIPKLAAALKGPVKAKLKATPAQLLKKAIAANLDAGLTMPETLAACKLMIKEVAAEMVADVAIAA